MSDSPHTAENWSAASEGYDTMVAEFTGRYSPALIERLGVDGDSRVVEIAAGTGALTLQLAPQVASLLATDYSSGMLQRLKNNLDGTDVTNVERAVMDATALDLEDDGFDAAVSSFGVMLVADRAAAFSELRRVVKPGGRVVVSGWSSPENFESFGIFGGAIRRAFPDLPPPSEPPAIFSLADPGRFAAEMEAAGLTDVRVDHVEQRMEIGSGDLLWDMLSSGAPPVRALFEKVGEAGMSRVRDALLAIVAERFGDGPLALRNVATVGTGIVPA